MHNHDDDAILEERKNRGWKYVYSTADNGIGNDGMDRVAWHSVICIHLSSTCKYLQ
jgi:hypothetical protein